MNGLGRCDADLWRFLLFQRMCMPCSSKLRYRLSDVRCMFIEPNSASELLWRRSSGEPSNTARHHLCHANDLWPPGNRPDWNSQFLQIRNEKPEVNHLYILIFELLKYSKVFSAPSGRPVSRPNAAAWLTRPAAEWQAISEHCSLNRQRIEHANLPHYSPLGKWGSLLRSLSFSHTI